MPDQPIPKSLMATLCEQVVVGLVVPEAPDGCSDGCSGGREKLYLSSFPLSRISLKCRWRFACTHRISQQRTFDGKWLGVGICYGCGHVLFTNLYACSTKQWLSHFRIFGFNMLMSYRLFYLPIRTEANLTRYIVINQTTLDCTVAMCKDSCTVFLDVGWL